MAGIPKNTTSDWLIKQYRSKWKIRDTNINTNYSSVCRNLSIKYNILNTTIHPMNTTISVFKLKKEHTDYANFAYLYTMPKSNTTTTPYDIIQKDLVFKYFCFGGSLISMDGEYRSNFCTFNSVNMFQKYPDIYNEVEQFLLEKIKNERIILYYEQFYPTKEQTKLSHSLEDGIRKNRLEIKFLILCWLSDMNKFQNNTMETHMNVKYLNVMYADKKNDMEFYAKLLKRFKYLELVINTISRFLPTKSSDFKGLHSIGQKITPINWKEIQYPFDISYAPWRELFVSKHLSNLVLNQISPNFPIIGNWFYVRNNRKGLFDNQSVYDRMENSEIARHIASQLMAAQRGTYELETKPNTASDIVKWVSNNFKHLHDKIETSLDYSKKELIMSEVALGMTSEFVGRTFYDSIQLSKSNTHYRDDIGNPFGEKNSVYFGAYMFGLTYALYCMNKFYHSIHGDLHLNNFTLHRIAPEYLYNFGKIKSPHVVFRAKNIDFAIPHCGYHVCIIDFSRTIIRPSQAHIFHDPLMKQYKINDKEFFHEEQSKNLKSLYNKYFPEILMKYNEEFDFLLKTQFDIMFLLLTPLDLYSVVTKLLHLYTSKDSKVDLGKLEILYSSSQKIGLMHKKSIELLNKIRNLCEVFVHSRLVKLLENPKGITDNIKNEELPMLQIIKSVFSARILTPEMLKNITIVDFFDSDYKIEHDIHTYNTLPKHITHSLSGLTIKPTNDKTSRLEYEQSIFESTNLIDFIANRHTEKLF